MKTELVQDWMTTEVISVSPRTTLPKAHELMTGHHIRRLPVIQRDGRLVGLPRNRKQDAALGFGFQAYTGG